MAFSSALLLGVVVGTSVESSGTVSGDAAFLGESLVLKVVSVTISNGLMLLVLVLAVVLSGTVSQDAGSTGGSIVLLKVVSLTISTVLLMLA